MYLFFKIKASVCTEAGIAQSVWWLAYGWDDRGIVVWFLAGTSDCVTASERPDQPLGPPNLVGPTQLSIEWGLESVYPGWKRPGHEVASYLRLLLRSRIMGSYLYSAVGLLGVHGGHLYFYQLSSRFCRFPFAIFYCVRLSFIAHIRCNVSWGHRGRIEV